MNSITQDNKRRALIGICLIVSAIILGYLFSNISFANAQVSTLRCSPAVRSIHGAGNFEAEAFGGTGNYTWSAPDGTTTTGTGKVFNTTFTRNGNYDIVLSDGVATSTCIASLVIAGTTLLPSTSPTFTGTPSPGNRAKPSDFGLGENELITSFNNDGDIDVYIINRFGFKKLYTSPGMFFVYGYTFDGVTQVSSQTREAFETSGILLSCQSPGQTYWGLEVVAEDIGVLHPLNMSVGQAIEQDSEFLQRVFCINELEAQQYTLGLPYATLSQILRYMRF